MINAKLPPFVYREKTRHGKFVFYFRQGKNGHGARVRLPDYGAPEFQAAYRAALAGAERAPVAKPGQTGTLAWLIARYREVEAWRSLSMATRRQRECILLQVLDNAGHVPATAVTRKKIVEGRDMRSKTPNQARHFLDTMRGLFKWAVEAEHVPLDPTLGVTNPKKIQSDGFAPWLPEEIAAYENRWPLGTRQRVWFDVLRYTGLRRSDAVRLGRQHVRNGIATLRPEKTKANGIDVHIRILPALAETLAAGPIGDLAWIIGEAGTPLTKESFGNMFREACDAAGVKKSAHGLRKVAAETAAEAGATVNELEALFGWSGGKMASLYTKRANRQKLAAQAMDKVENVYRIDSKSAAQS